MSNNRSSRRDFFLSGGAALGAGVAAAGGSQPALAPIHDSDAIRQLQQSFAALVENRDYEAAARLFDARATLHLKGASASGTAQILQLLAGQTRHQEGTALHSAFRHNPVKPEVLTISKDGMQAAATFHVDTELSTPLQGDCTAAQMARLQGQAASRHWESGRLEATYVKSNGRWKVASLSYRVA
jgi:hypothetical protein